MSRTFQLTQLTDAVDSNVPAGTIILDTTGNVQVFYKYKGTLVERDSAEFNHSTIRSRIKHAVSRGSTLAFRIHQEDNISEYLVPESINPIIMNKSKITSDYLESLSSGRDDFVNHDKDYRFVFVINGTSIPDCLRPFVANGDLVPITIV